MPVDTATFLSVPELGGLEAIRATFRQHHFAPHYHETYLVGVTEGGVELFEARGQSYASTAGSVRLFNPGEVHTGRAPEGRSWSYRAFYPSAELMRRAAADLCRRPVPTPTFKDCIVTDRPMADLVLNAHGSLEEPLSSLERDCRITTMLSELIRRHACERPVVGRPGREHAAVRRARDYILANAAHNFSLHELAAASHLSPYHLIRVFKKEVGLSPFAYLIQARIDMAKALLRKGHIVGRIATECGFADQSHLHRAFRQRVGVPPGHYARAVRGT